MITLLEIETAADALAPEDQEELLRFLALRLRKERATPKTPNLFLRGAVFHAIRG
jgi:hypothetical protein